MKSIAIALLFVAACNESPRGLPPAKEWRIAPSANLVHAPQPSQHPEAQQSAQDDLPANHPPLDQLPANHPPLDQLPANHPPLDQLPANHPPIDQLPANHPPID